MEDNKSGVVQGKGNLDITEDKYGFFHMNYGGEITFTTLENLNLMLGQIKKLSREVKAEKEQNLDLKSEIQRLRNENAKLIAEIPNLRKVAEDYKNKYEKFTQNHKKVNNTVLTQDYKDMLKSMASSQNKMSLMDMYKAMVLHGYKGTYESVRKYVAQSRKAKEWL